MEFSTVKHDYHQALYKLSRVVQFGLFTLGVATWAIFSLAEEALKFANAPRVGLHNIFRYNFLPRGEAPWEEKGNLREPKRTISKES